KLFKHFGFAVGIGANIYNYPDAAVQFGSKAGNAGTHETFHGFYAEKSANQYGSGSSGAGKGVNFAGFQQAITSGNAGIRFMGGCISRMIADFYNLSSMYNRDHGSWRAVCI